MKQSILTKMAMVIIGLVLLSCNLLSTADPSLEATQVALSVQQTSLAIEQEAAAIQPEQPALQPTYTPYPTYTPEVKEAPQEQPTTAFDSPPDVEDPALATSFDGWLKDVNILVYEDMWGSGEPLVVSSAIDALGLGRNTINVRDAMGHLLSNMNSATQWDLIIIAAESRNRISGEYFDVLSDQLDRGASVIIEIWYINQISFGRIQPVMQRCGIAFHQDWWRDFDSNLNTYLVYLLEPDHPLFSVPNTISMLIPYDVLWYGDVGDTVKLVPGSDAVLLAGRLPREHSAYGLIAECMDGRMVWQTFSTHDYKNNEVLSLWQNYIYNTLQARYEYLQQ